MTFNELADKLSRISVTLDSLRDEVEELYVQGGDDRTENTLHKILKDLSESINLIDGAALGLDSLA